MWTVRRNGRRLANVLPTDCSSLSRCVVKRTLSPAGRPRIEPQETFPPRFVPANLAGSDWRAIEQLGTVLLNRSCANGPELERWLEDMSELTACVHEEGNLRHIAMIRHTDDTEAEQAYLRWTREFQPQWERLENQLLEAYLGNPHRKALPARYRVFDRIVQNQHDLYRESNVPLLVKERERKQAYQKRFGAMTVNYKGREYTRPQATEFLESTERSVRQTVWTLLTERALAERDPLDALFDELLAVRHDIARNAGLPSYRDYAFRERRRFDYGPDECKRFHEGVERYFTPLVVRLAEERSSAMKLPVQRPWDLLADPLGRQPLSGFDDGSRLIDRCEAVLQAVSPEFGECVRSLRADGLLDVERRKGKAPGAWRFPLPRRRRSFVFMNYPPSIELQSLIHEFGHVIHYMLARRDPILQYQSAPLEFAEVASTTLELFAAPHLGLAYANVADARRAYRQLLDATIMAFPRVATVDAFQHWAYEHLGHSSVERHAVWSSLYRRFHADSVDWAGYENALGASWQLQSHIFLSPFYYIEYGISRVAALTLWLRAEQGDRAGTLDTYLAALALGGSRPLPELFAAAGVPLRFDGETMAPLADALARALDQLPYSS
jgi:oligoendopeptidase F